MQVADAQIGQMRFKARWANILHMTPTSNTDGVAVGQRKRQPGAVALVLVIILLFPTAVFAHRPIFANGAGASFATAVKIPDPEVQGLCVLSTDASNESNRAFWMTAMEAQPLGDFWHPFWCNKLRVKSLSIAITDGSLPTWIRLRSSPRVTSLT